ncbi:MAG: IS21 family transposase [Dehalococcoidales bacterium]|nr:IS21 family transposase [Dehalococcoidales bacterium]
MDKVYVIRHKVMVEGKSIRSVARELDVSRNTVTKYLGLSQPVRKESVPRPHPVMEKVAVRIDEIQREWAHRVTPKQRLTGSRIHRQLIVDHYQVGITTVRDYLREKRRRSAEVYIPLVHRPGEEGQFDFFEVTVEENGEFYRAWKLLLHLPYSGHDFLWLYNSCDQLAFLDGHVRAAAYFGGLPQRIVYDNLTPAVKRRVGLGPQLTERFQSLVSHYLFEPCFARLGEGHDKGGVESRGKSIRLQHMTPVPRGNSLTEISMAVLREVDEAWRERVQQDGRRCCDMWQEECPQLIALPDRPFEARRVMLVQVSNKSTVDIEKARYSVPSGWARLEATAYIGVDDIRLGCRGETEVVPRQRRGGRRIQYHHYLPELAKKPQAVRQVAPELVAELGEPYGKLWSLLVSRYGPQEAARVLSRVLGAIVDHGSQAVAGALEAAFQAGRCDLLALPSRLQQPTVMVEVPAALQGYHIESASPADYDVLLAGGVR